MLCLSEEETSVVVGEDSEDEEGEEGIRRRDKSKKSTSSDSKGMYLIMCADKSMVPLIVQHFSKCS